MGRPPLPLGTSGKVLFLNMPNGRVQARAKFRDYDGRVRLVSKVRRSRAAAERALKAELTSRQAPGGVGAIRSGSGPRGSKTGWWETPLWQYAVYAVAVYSRAAVERLRVPVREIARRIGTPHGLELTA